MPEASETRKVVRVVVRDGQKAGSRALTFEGAQALSPNALRDALQALGLADYAWIDPSVVVEPLRSEYARAGYRAASIVPGTPRVEADRAVLPVTISEGPVTRVARVTLDGVDEGVRTAIETAGRLPEGQPYREDDVDAARRRIEAVYRSRGFNDVLVTPRVAADAEEGTVTVAFVVKTGLEQRLADVVVDGVGRTRPSAVISALRLDPGAPVDFAKWAQARKRVFDTNVFRQVEVRPEVLPSAGPDGTEAVRARVTVTEWPAWRLRYGLQLEDNSLTEFVDTPGQRQAPPGRRRRSAEPQRVRARLYIRRLRTAGKHSRFEQHLRDVPDAVRPRRPDQRVRVRLPGGPVVRQRFRTRAAAHQTGDVDRAADPTRPRVRAGLQLPPQSRAAEAVRSGRPVLV